MLATMTQSRSSIPKICVPIAAMLVAFYSCRGARVDRTTDALVRETLDAQVAAWNRGNIRGFMEGYYNSPSTSFLSGTKLTRGFEPVLDGYLNRYPVGKQGKLQFEILEVVPLSNDAAYAIGRFRLDGDVTQSGMFTLILRRVGDRFVIVHDHTAADSAPASEKR